MGGFLVRKLVKPTKVFYSWASYQSRRGQILPAQTEADVGTAGAGVVRESDATVGQKFGGFDSSDRILDQSPELFGLFVGDNCPEVLNFDQTLADEHQSSDVSDTGDP
jgi:hypothetical protein